MLALAALTEEQQFFIDLFMSEKTTGLRHWQRDPSNPEIYVEYLNAYAFLNGLLNNEIENANKPAPPSKK